MNRYSPAKKTKHKFILPQIWLKQSVIKDLVAQNSC